jgi:nitronate monooxygenase
MDSIERRYFVKGVAAGALASSIAAAEDLRAQAQVTLPNTVKWPTRRLIDLLKIELPIIQAPMPGHMGADMVIAVAEAGGLGSVPSARSTPKQLGEEVAKIRSRTHKPINLNFWCHALPKRDEAIESAWLKRLSVYYVELGLKAPGASAILGPFNAEMCDVVAELKPEVVSFHIGLPEASLVKRVKDSGCVVLSSATTVAEARWLEDHGADAIIAQGVEAGGHRGMFLATDVAAQVGTFALVPQVVDAVHVPVIAAGGIADGRGIAAAFALGAAGVQCGTAYLFCPESTVSPIHRASLKSAHDDSTAISTIFTGRPARSIMNRIMRELGPLPDGVPDFPLASTAMRPLALKAEAKGSPDFTQLYSGQAVTLCRELPARELTLKLAAQALERLGGLAAYR